MWLAKLVCMLQFFKTPNGLCGHTVLHVLEAQMQDVNDQSNIAKVSHVQEITFTAHISIIEHVTVFCHKHHIVRKSFTMLEAVTTTECSEVFVANQESQYRIGI
jgi:hypothetical protein